MVKKMSLGGIKPDVTSPKQLLEQARSIQRGRLQARAKWWQVVTVLGLLVIVVAIAAFLLIQIMWATPALDSSRYQAVFLDDGKVFFGKLKNTNGEYITLATAYYTSTSQSSNKSSTVDQTALVKVGSESYGPDNSIQIARSKILFWQNLRKDSQITKAIENRVSQ